jgi:L-asparaginase II
VQRRIAAALGELLGCDCDRLPRGADGCGVPVWAAPLQNIGRAYARLATATGQAATEAALARIREAMTGHARMVSGTHGADTILMEVVGGDLVAKGGAEGLRCIGVRSLGLGLAIRCEDGSFRGLDPVVPALLAQLGAIDGTVEARLQERLPCELRNWPGDPIGEVVSRAVWTRA